MNNIEKQLICMRKLNVPENKIQEILTRYSNDNLLDKLIDCEEKYTEINKPIPGKIIDCEYWSVIVKKCRMYGDCINPKECKDNLNFDITKVFTQDTK